MASKSKSIYCPNYSSSLPFTLSVSFSESSYSVTDNTSTLSLSASIKSGGVSFDTNYNNTLQIYWYDDNANSSGKLVKTLNVQDLSKNATASTSGTLTVTHKADGSLSGYAKAVWTKHSSNSSVGYVPSSGNVQTSNTALTTIPRKSSMSLSASSCYAGNNITINIARASTSFTHAIHYNINGGSWTLITNGVGDSYIWTVPMSLITATGNYSATINVLVETYNGSSYIGNTSQSFVLTPYGASTISSYSGNTIGGDMTINIARNSTSFTHTVVYYYGNASGTINTGVGASTTWKSIDMNLCNQTPNSASGTGTLYVYTYYGSLQIGSAQGKSFTINVPSSVVPTFSSLNLTRVDNGVPSSWGVYVKGYSKVTASVSGASGSYGSTISSYYISGAGSSTSSSSMTTGVLTSAKTYEFTAYVKDSRGRTSSEKKASITVVDYSKPSISIVSAQRCTSDGTVNSSGTYLLVKCTYGYASVGGKNSVSVSVSCNGASKTSFSSGTSFILNANCSIGSMYTVTATITDGLGNNATATALIPTAERIFNVSANGKGWAFGGFATEDDTLQVYGDVEANNLPITGILGEFGNIGCADLRNYKCFIGSLLEAGQTWYNVISVRHRNGLVDGNQYGMFIRSKMTEQGSKLIWNQQVTGTWGTDRTIIDSSGGSISGELWVGGTTYFHSNNNAIGSCNITSDGWIGFYADAYHAYIKANRKGWIGHSGESHLYIYNEAGGVIQFLTGGDNWMNLEFNANGGHLRFQTNTGWLSGPNHGILPYHYNNNQVEGRSSVGAGGWYFNSSYISNMYFYNSSNVSDRKVKDNIQDIEKAKAFILGLKPCEYTFKEGDSKGKRRHMGFIAQEVSQLANELEMGNIAIYSASVNTGEKDENGMDIEGYYDENIDDEKLSWSLRYNEFIAPMVVTIQEQQKQIDELQRQIELLK